MLRGRVQSYLPAGTNIVYLGYGNALVHSHILLSKTHTHTHTHTHRVNFGKFCINSISYTALKVVLQVHDQQKIKNSPLDYCCALPKELLLKLTPTIYLFITILKETQWLPIHLWTQIFLSPPLFPFSFLATFIPASRFSIWFSSLSHHKAPWSTSG